MRFAHLTDLHLPIPIRPRLTELMSKRLFGYLSWRQNRCFRHTRGALDAILDDLRAQAPDFTAISGDIANISLGPEFSAAAQWLDANLDAARTVLAPGNHDAYVAYPWHEGLGKLGAYMTADSGGMPTGPGDFPFTRTIGDVGFVVANSSPPTAPFLATGRLGTSQIERIGKALADLGASGKCRVLVLHHPITDNATPRRKALADRALLRQTIGESGFELAVHGHTHKSLWFSVVTKDGPRPVVCGGSASHPRAKGAYRPARYNLFSIDGSAFKGWRIAVDVRELDPQNGRVKTVEQRTLLANAR